ncbi:MAG TPA: hypothetical protein VHK69_19540 [Chitinophagaceae bacterium]|jgi:hypothetical protein|nr:hypothetical protein [Chitinophagaceae bacterium]
MQLVEPTLFRKRISLNTTEPPEPATAGISRYQIFVCGLALATLFHMANKNSFTNGLHHFLLTAAALLLLQKSSSIARLVFFLTLQLYEAFKMMPQVSNHWIFTTFVNLTLVQVLFSEVIRSRSFRVSKHRFFETAAPILRIELIILYFFAVFHKLNSGFFATDVSCAADFFKAQVPQWLLPATDAVVWFNIYGTLVIESLIPLLLVFRKTRNLGLFIGFAFHCLLAFNPLNGFYDFSSIVFALYFVFTDASFTERVNRFAFRVRQRKNGVKAYLQSLSFSPRNLALFIGLILSIAGGMHLLSKLFPDYFRYVLWTVYSFGVIVLFAQSWLVPSRLPAQERNYFKIARLAFVLMPLVTFLNGLCPYLGLKTENSFSMFSNLRTEGGVTNHYLVPTSVQLFDFQKDVVLIQSSDNPTFQRLAREGKMMTFYTFRQHVQNEKPGRVNYVRNGRPATFSYATASRNDELLQKPSYLLATLLRFRYFRPAGQQPCAH